MPSHIQLKKDAANGETRRGAVRTQRSVGIRMEKSDNGNALSSMSKSIAHEERNPELKHISTWRKRK